jgi:hypothetical protein
MKNKNLVLVVVLVAAMVAVGIFWLGMSKIEPVSVDPLQWKSVSEGEKTSDTQTNETVWYEVPELGVKFLVPKDFAQDLIYSYAGEYAQHDSNGKVVGKKVKSVNLSTKSVVSSLGKSCSPELDGLGSISRYEGNMNQYDVIKNADDVKQLRAFAIHYSGSQSVCADKEKSKEEIVSATKKYLEFFSSKEFLDSMEELSK